MGKSSRFKLQLSILVLIIAVPLLSSPSIAGEREQQLGSGRLGLGATMVAQLAKPVLTTIPPKTSISATYRRPYQTNLPTVNVTTILRPTAIKSLIRPPQSPKMARNNSYKIPARDRVMDFGKHKGRMLGTLPSTYLKWISSNLRAGETEEWANLADEVLADPVYKERLEWEVAEKVLTGSGLMRANSTDGRNAAAKLSEICERFGWDEGDKEGWSKIDFGLLGTSMGRRIPRRKEGNGEGLEKKESTKLAGGDDDLGEGWGGRRRERRQRARRRRTENIAGRNIDDEHRRGGGEISPTAERVVAGSRPFPGREAFLKKVLNGENLL